MTEICTEEHVFSDLSNDFAINLRLPDLDSFEYGKLEDISPPETNAADRSSEHGITERAQEVDIWQLQSDSPSKPSALRTWEAFLDETHIEPRTTYITEAGPNAFDALLDDHSRKPSEVLQPAFFLKCLGLLGLGRSSALFHWNAKSRTYEQTLESVRYMGCSMPCTISIIRELSQIGTLFVELRAFVETSYLAKQPLSARIALARCFQVILEVLDRELASHVPNVKTPLQLLSSLHVPGRVLSDLREFAKASSSSRSNSDFISKTHRKVQELTKTCTPFSEIYGDILDRVCRPWQQIVRMTVGLDCQPSAVCNAEDAATLSNLITPEDGQLVTEISAGLNILRSSLPNHPLTNTSSWGIKSVDIDETDMDTVLLKAQQYERDLMDAVEKYEDRGSSHTSDWQDLAIATFAATEHEQLPWQDNELQQDYFAEIGDRFAQPPSVNFLSLETSPEELRDLVVAAIQSPGTCDISPPFNDLAKIAIAPIDLNPLRTLQPLLSVQARIINGSTMRLLFRHCGLRKHLSLQHSFHLFGNGVFLQRLSSALFSSESSSAERNHGNVPSGVGMGLRLDSRDRWPPASSELRLSLMGILSESYNGQSLPTKDKEHASALGASQDLPGGLSFAIREMEDAEIEKIMDSHSIFALDFLRLQYTAPAPLDAVITSSSLLKYDDIFRFLLRLVRMIHVTTAMKISTCHSPHSATNKTLKAFAYEAYHVVAALASYIFNVGISVPWRNLNNRLDELEADLLLEDKGGGYGSRVTLGLQGLCATHERMIDSIRTRLLLRRKQDKVRETVEALFRIILEVQRFVQAGNTSAVKELHEEMNSEVQKLLGLLHESSSKAYKRGVAADEREDTEAFEMLRVQLDMNGYYRSTEDVLLI